MATLIERLNSLIQAIGADVKVLQTTPSGGAEIGDIIQTARVLSADYKLTDGSLLLQSAYPSLYATLGLIRTGIFSSDTLIYSYVKNFLISSNYLIANKESSYYYFNALSWQSRSSPGGNILNIVYSTTSGYYFLVDSTTVFSSYFNVNSFSEATNIETLLDGYVATPSNWEICQIGCLEDKIVIYGRDTAAVGTCIIISTDGGYNWDIVVIHLNDYGGGCSNIRIAPNGRIFFFSGSYLLTSANNGTTITQIQYPSSTDILFLTGNVIITSKNDLGKICRSTDGGSTWTDIVVTSDSLYCTNLIKFDVTCYAFFNMHSGNTKLYESSDDGLTWFLVNSSLGIVNAGITYPSYMGEFYGKVYRLTGYPGNLKELALSDYNTDTHFRLPTVASPTTEVKTYIRALKT